MKKIVLTIAFIGFILNGCIQLVPVPYDGDIDKTKKNKQYIEHSQCKDLVGPFTFFDDDNLSVKSLIAGALKKGKEQGMYGNKLINITINEGGSTLILTSKLCLYLTGNIIYEEE